MYFSRCLATCLFKVVCILTLPKVPESLDNIFDDDDTDLHDYQGSKLTSQSSVMEVKKSGSSKDILVDLHRMFPTPPSVEQVLQQPLCTYVHVCLLLCLSI